jgi:hypothetical protein
MTRLTRVTPGSVLELVRLVTSGWSFSHIGVVIPYHCGHIFPNRSLSQLETSDRVLSYALFWVADFPGAISAQPKDMT